MDAKILGLVSVSTLAPAPVCHASVVALNPQLAF